MKRWLRITFYLGLLTLLLVAFCDTLVESSSEGSVYTNLHEIPAKKTALVLGTMYKNSHGSINPYFKYRMEAAANLYKSGKVKYIIVSGDNGSKSYDESTDMKNVLIQLGVPQEVIYLDYAGFRTLDSAVRCKEVFDQDDIIVVSQKFHNQRAVFIGQAKGVKAIGYNAKDVAFARGYVVLVREKLARVKAVLDMIVGKQPKFYGSKVAVGNA